jgi:hypothetical protein
VEQLEIAADGFRLQSMVARGDVCSRDRLAEVHPRSIGRAPPKIDWQRSTQDRKTASIMCSLLPEVSESEQKPKKVPLQSVATRATHTTSSACSRSASGDATICSISRLRFLSMRVWPQTCTSRDTQSNYDQALLTGRGAAGHVARIPLPRCLRTCSSDPSAASETRAAALMALIV